MTVVSDKKEETSGLKFTFSGDNEDKGMSKCDFVLAENI